MTHLRTWTVDIAIDEHEDQRRTHARAHLHSGERPSLTGDGEAHRNPSDREIPAIGDELAVARALADLSHQLLEQAAQDVQTTARTLA